MSFHWSRLWCHPSKNWHAESTPIQVEEVNESREHMFIKVSRCLENIPPQRMLFIRCMSKKTELLTPWDWGWEWNPRLSIWVPYWTDLEDASNGCRLLITCGCKKYWTTNCNYLVAFVVALYVNVKVCVQIMKCNVTWCFSCYLFFKSCLYLKCQLWTSLKKPTHNLSIW